MKSTAAEALLAPSEPAGMTPTERRASVALAAIYALRMLGLFLILPVFAVYAHTLPGGAEPSMIGLAIGIYGLTQAALQIVFGRASDRFGRKPVIVFGLGLFALGSFVAAIAHSIEWIIVGRAIQGAGAISAAITALVADATRDRQRSKAMAMIGASIGVTFAASMVAAPLLYGAIGMPGIFALTGALAIAAIGVVKFVVPDVPQPALGARVPFREVLANRQLLRLDFGIFALHVAQAAMFVVVPVLLVDVAGVPVVEHWKLYLPAVTVAFVLMVPAIIAAERGGRMRRVFVGAIVLMALVEAVASRFATGQLPVDFWTMLALLLGFFIAFNVLEALLPSLVSKIAPPAAKGTALGVYNTVQSLGVSAGGSLGGWVATHFGRAAVFEVCAGLMVVWAIAALGMRVPVHSR
ncbi:MFS transporter [Derxia lacustris]|uniref:MFS transporter n=1 Tax=Derxia lacustris TaxID=764842 RepID=UPI000A16D11B|nr:MFS transporter [Derxia lacustris]